MLTSRTSVETYAPSVSLEIIGRSIPEDLTWSILNIRIIQKMNGQTRFTVQIQDELQSSSGRFRWLDSEYVKFGNPVSISLGYPGNLVQMIEGKIQNIDADFSEGGSVSFTIEGLDEGGEWLHRSSPAKDFVQGRDSTVVREVARLANFEAIVDETDGVKKRTKIAKNSYFNFLRTLALENEGFEFRTGKRKLWFVKEQRLANPVQTLRWGEDLLSFRPQINTSHLVSEVVVRSWDQLKKRPIVGRARAGSEKKQEENKQFASLIAKHVYGDVVKELNEPVKNVKEAERLAQAELDQHSQQLVTVGGDTIGLPHVTVGECINISGVGEWFSGKYYLRTVTHTLSQKGYRTSFEGTRNAL